MIYPYVSFPPDDLSRPFLPVLVFGPKHQVLEFMIVDSGADISVMPARIARDLGLALDRARVDTFELADGLMTEAKVLDVGVEICGHRLNLPVAFLENDSVLPLLGQQGFFDRFEVRFRRYQEEFEVLTPDP